MKNLAAIIIILNLFVGQLLGQTNGDSTQKEVFIIGTMHEVPGFFKNSYKPLYKKALAYRPDAIYVERIRPQDNVSMEKTIPWLIEASDSMKQVVEVDETRFEKLASTNPKEMTQEDFVFMYKAYIIKKDHANFRYYQYLAKYGVEGSKKPSREENGDVSYKLASTLGIPYIHSMDDQTHRDKYFKAWQECAKESEKNGENKGLRRLVIRETLRSIFPSIFGRLGHYTNKKKTLEVYHKVNSFRYVENQCEPCSDGLHYWDDRNNSMARNIGTQVLENNKRKNLVVVGAGHVVGLKEALNRQFPEIKVTTIYKLDDKEPEGQNQVAAK